MTHDTIPTTTGPATVHYVTDPCHHCLGDGCKHCDHTGHWFNPYTLYHWEMEAKHAREDDRFALLGPDVLEHLLLICKAVYPIEAKDPKTHKVSTVPVNLLRQARLQRDLSLRDVSAATGIAFSYLSDLERGVKADPSLSVVRKLSRFFGLPITTLFPERSAS